MSAWRSSIFRVVRDDQFSVACSRKRRSRLGSRALTSSSLSEAWFRRALLARWILWLWRFREQRIWDRLVTAIPRGAVVSRRYRRGRLYLELGRSAAHWRLWVRGSALAPEIRILEQRIREGSRILDVGANLGYLAMVLSEVVGETGSVLCFEPDPDNARELRRNLERNRIANIEVSEAAVGSSAGRVRFRRGLNGIVDEGGDMDVEMVCLDDLRCGRVDLIKIDVEGGEGEVLEGARDLVDREHPDLFVEVHPTLLHGWTHDQVFDWLEARYESIEAFEVRPDSGLTSKILRRYLGYRGEITADLNSLREECSQGVRSGVFWLLARGGRAGREGSEMNRTSVEG